MAGTSYSDNPLQRLLEARCPEPFSILGRHAKGNDDVIVRAFLPRSSAVYLGEQQLPMQRLDNTDIFEWQGPGPQVPEHYLIIRQDDQGNTHSFYDPYCFPQQTKKYDLKQLNQGEHGKLYRFMGAHGHSVSGIEGILFVVWAPHAERVSIIGEFNHWDGRCHPMRTCGDSGVWELFIPGLTQGTTYNYEIRNRQNDKLLTKADPFSRDLHLEPSVVSIVPTRSTYGWHDQAWLTRRKNQEWQKIPVSIYEVHLGSWQRDENHAFLNYRELAKRLVDYVSSLGFTHIELMPINEHPFYGSWGYQSIAYFSPTNRYGNVDDFRFFVDYCHQHGIGVILDWVPAHFPKDSTGLGYFDGDTLYEHADKRRSEQRNWNTSIFDYARNEVRDYLISNACYWLEEFHIDGLRTDAVASMLYLDYSAKNAQEWVRNKYGGRENLDAVNFLRRLNSTLKEHHPECMVIAEESTVWPKVTSAVTEDGLGFDMKWNMGWMHDTLKYFSQDPIYRAHHHRKLTFGLMYAYTENFLLPLSHDEVVHGKSPLLYKMWGDEWQKFANLRLLFSYMFTYPGKKLLFMGNEFGQTKEWDHDSILEWHLLQHPIHQGLQDLVRDINRLYRQERALHELDFKQAGFQWLSCDETELSLIAYQRKAKNTSIIVVMNCTPVVRDNFRLGVPQKGKYKEIFNSDSDYYSGSNVGNPGILKTEAKPCNGQEHSLEIVLPPLAAILLKLQ